MKSRVLSFILSLAFAFPAFAAPLLQEAPTSSRVCMSRDLLLDKIHRNPKSISIFSGQIAQGGLFEVWTDGELWISFISTMSAPAPGAGGEDEHGHGAAPTITSCLISAGKKIQFNAPPCTFKGDCA